MLCFNVASSTFDISKWCKRHFYEPFPVKQRKHMLKIYMQYLLIFFCTKNKNLIFRALSNETFINMDSLMMAIERSLNKYAKLLRVRK